MNPLFHRIPNITVVTGHYGSGKTEVAINLAMAEKKRFNEVILVDLDIVNPFYRSSELKSELEVAGIQVIAPNFAFTNVDVPSLSPAVQGVFSKESARVIIDVGGDDMGAKVLGVYFEQFKTANYEMLFVMNSRRQMTRRLDEIIPMIREIEKTSRLKITGIVANTNLSEETELAHIFEGIDLGIEVSKRINIPIKSVAVWESILEESIDEILERTYKIDMVYTPIKRYLTHWHGR